MGKAIARVKILSDPLIELSGISEKSIELSEGEYKFNELVEILKEKIPGLGRVFETRRIGKEVFIAVNSRVIYDLNKRVSLRDNSVISIFTLGAGG